MISDWLNAHYIKNMHNDTLAAHLKAYGADIEGHDKKEILLDALKERAKTLTELARMVNEVLSAPEAYDQKARKKALKADSKAILEAFAQTLESSTDLHLPSDYHGKMEAIVGAMGIGFGKIGMPLRLALMGKLSGPGVDTIMAVIGKDATLERIHNLIQTLD